MEVRGNSGRSGSSTNLSDSVGDYNRTTAQVSSQL